MDTKSLAKSKRAHSQHLSKKHHPNPKSKPQPNSNPSDANAKKPAGKQITEKPRTPALPSNWDRYHEEFDSEAVSTDGTSKASDVVVPKSKGADFAHLLSEAQSQLQSQTSDNSARFTSFDDVLPDFNQGMRSMLSVRGNGMLSWLGNDNFIVDDCWATSDEASFISMDLHALASRLEMLDVSRRLFIEEDILPPQLNVEGSKETIKAAFEEDVSGAVEQYLDAEKNIPDSSTSGGSVQSVSNLINQVNDESIEIEGVKICKFEAELDMLLNSFGEIKLPDSSGQVSNSSTSVVVRLEVDDTIDDLLGETSSIKVRNAVPKQKVVVSDLLEGFDSWLDTI